jgi:hypothetical protein
MPMKMAAVPELLITRSWADAKVEAVAAAVVYTVPAVVVTDATVCQVAAIAT